MSICHICNNSGTFKSIKWELFPIIERNVKINKKKHSVLRELEGMPMGDIELNR